MIEADVPTSFKYTYDKITYLLLRLDNFVRESELVLRRRKK